MVPIEEEQYKEKDHFKGKLMSSESGQKEVKMSETNLEVSTILLIAHN